jgi:hypothetical protein
MTQYYNNKSLLNQIEQSPRYPHMVPETKLQFYIIY